MDPEAQLKKIDQIGGVQVAVGRPLVAANDGIPSLLEADEMALCRMWLSCF